MPQDRKTGNVLGANIDALSWDDAMARLLGWARARAKAAMSDLTKAEYRRRP